MGKQGFRLLEVIALLSIHRSTYIFPVNMAGPLFAVRDELRIGFLIAYNNDYLKAHRHRLRDDVYWIDFAVSTREGTCVLCPGNSWYFVLLLTTTPCFEEEPCS